MFQLSHSGALATSPRPPRPHALHAVASEARAGPEHRPSMIELEGVSKAFGEPGRGGATAISDITVCLPVRSITLIKGPSGSGKTTLLAIIACMMRPSAGRVRVAGHDATRMSEDGLAELRRTHFGFVFQSNHLIQRATALENVMVPGLPCPEFNGDLRLRARALLSRLGLEAKVHRRVEGLSGGEQQRVAIARALVNDPEVLIADEPTAHLDSSSADAFIQLAFDLLARGKSVIVASHDPAVCGIGSYHRVFELHNGRLV